MCMVVIDVDNMVEWVGKIERGKNIYHQQIKDTPDRVRQPNLLKQCQINAPPGAVLPDASLPICWRRLSRNISTIRLLEMVE